MKKAFEILGEKGQKIISVTEDTIIIDALKKMNENKIGAILINRGNEYVGIWTERDLMRNTLEDKFNPHTAKIGDYMTTGLISVQHTDSVYSLLDVFLGKRLRHLLVEKEGEFIGVISTGDVIKASLNEKTQELRELNAMVSWEYYENWRWKAK